MILEFICPSPPLYAECHASTLARLSDGTLMAAWFAGTKEGHNDVAIWGSRRSSEGWSTPFVLALKINDLPHWNPVLHCCGREVTLFFKVGRNCSHWRTWIMKSEHDGKTWDEPREMVPGNIGGRGPVKNKCIDLADGSWLAPASSERGKSWKAFVDRSSDHGLTWKRSELISQPSRAVGKDANGRDIMFGVIQPALWESDPGHIHMLLRSSCGKICRSDSGDGGRNWCQVYETELPNNNSGIDLAKLDDGSLLLAYNPVGKNWGPRWPLSLARSKDNGASWETICDLASEAGGEYSYPAVIALPGNGAAASFTWKRQKIAVAILSGI